MFVESATLNTLIVALDIQKARQTTAAYNVANYSRGDLATIELEFDTLLSALLAADNNVIIRQALAAGVESYASVKHQEAGSVSMEELIMSSERAESRYKATAEILDRHLALIHLSVKGN